MPETSGVEKASGVRIVLNGETKELIEGTTLAGLLAELGREPLAVAVERNGEIVPRASYGDVELGDGDRLEIVQFVQGG